MVRPALHWISRRQHASVCIREARMVRSSFLTETAPHGFSSRAAFIAWFLKCASSIGTFGVLDMEYLPETNKF